MLHFERDLPTHAEPVSASDLEIGETYFSVQYLDEDLLVPKVETLILAGKEQDTGGGAVFCFQDLDSYRQGIRHGSADVMKGVFYLQDERDVKHIFKYERAVDELIKCALRRRKREQAAEG